jgi:hypothetical protein
MAPQMPMAPVARLVDEHDTQLWRLIDHHIDDARRRRNDTRVRAIGIGETSSRGGHDYITLFVDLAKSQLLVRHAGHEREYGDAVPGGFCCLRRSAPAVGGRLRRHVDRLHQRGGRGLSLRADHL